MPSDPPKRRNPTTPETPGDQFGHLYEQIHRRPRGSSGILFGALMVAVIVHGVVLVMLAGHRFGSAPPKKKPTIEIQTDIIEDYQPKPEIVRQVIRLSDQSSPAQRSARYAGQLRRSDNASAVIGVDPLDASGLAFDLRRGQGRKPADTWRERSGGAGLNLTQRVQRPGGQDMQSAMDAMARPIVSTIARRKLLVVLIFDGSRSLIKERDLLGAQLQRTFDELKFAITESQEARLDWAVVGFGKNARVVLKPTRDVRKIQSALKRMPVDKSGKENVLKALNFAMDKLSRRGWRLALVLMTDEQGDDVGTRANATPQEKKALEKVVRRCLQKKARVFVLGREALFRRSGREYVVEEKGQRLVGYQDLGYTSCRREIPYQARYAGIAPTYLPAGLGCYTLSLLTSRTHGKFLIVSDKPSAYRVSDIEPYMPAYDYPDAYDRKAKSDVVRKEVLKAAQAVPNWSWRTFRGKGPWTTQRVHWQKRLQECEKRLVECRKDLRTLNRLSRRAAKAGKRWEANFDLTRADLCKERAMLLQYIRTIHSLLKTQPPLTGVKKPGLVVTYRIWLDKPLPKSPKDIPGDRAVRHAVEAARRALELVVRKHKGSAWAAAAKIELKYFYSLKIFAYWGPPKDAPGLERTNL